MTRHLASCNARGPTAGRATELNLCKNKTTLEGKAGMNPPTRTSSKTTTAKEKGPAHGPNTGRLLLALPVADLRAPGGGAWKGKVNLKRSEVAEFQGEPVIKAYFKKGSGTSQHPHQDANGLAVSCQAVAGMRSCTVSFDIMFDPARWQWSKGGKIGGFFVGKGEASGGRHTPDGSSFRLMFQADGGAISYIYWPSGVPQPGVPQAGRDFGEGYHKDVFAGVFVPGRWHRVTMGIKLNSFKGNTPAGDGRASLAIDGRVAKFDKVNWAPTPDATVASFDLAAFFGGPDPATVDSVFYAKNFKVSELKD